MSRTLILTLTLTLALALTRTLTLAVTVNLTQTLARIQGLTLTLTITLTRFARVAHVLDEPCRFGVDPATRKREGGTFTTWLALEP